MSQHAPLCDPCKLGVKHYMRLIAWPYYYSTTVLQSVGLFAVVSINVSIA